MYSTALQMGAVRYEVAFDLRSGGTREPGAKQLRGMDYYGGGLAVVLYCTSLVPWIRE